MTFDSSITF